MYTSAIYLPDHTVVVPRLQLLLRGSRDHPSGTVFDRRSRWRFCYDGGVWQSVTSRAAGRIAGRAVARQMRQGRAFTRHVVPAVMKPAKTLWNQFIAFLFCSMGIIFAFRTVQLARDFDKVPASEGVGPLFRLLAAGFCTALMLGFGITSYFRARKISSS
jgi:hypothetical protein